MFFEVYNRARFQGEIGLATSFDTTHWKYQRVSLTETHHLEYPQVLPDCGRYYMTPDTAGQGVKLYRATRFSFDWQCEATLLNGPGVSDPTVFRHDNLWWMISGYTSDAL